MTRVRTAFFVTSLVLAAVTQAQAAEFPQGTQQFFNTGASGGVTAADGGVWIATPQGLVHYTAAGPSPVLVTPGHGAPRNLVLAADGSIWYSNETAIARISPTGMVLELYSIAGAIDIAVASDGALWYTRGLGSNNVVGRIASGVTTEFAVQGWSLAPAAGGDMWAVRSGFGTPTDSLYRVTPLGAVTEIPLNEDVLFGELRTLPDGTLYIGTGVRILRLDPGSQTPVPFTQVSDPFLPDAVGNIWWGTLSVLGYVGRAGMPDIRAEMPSDTRTCVNRNYYIYRPVALDSTGGLWVALVPDIAFGIPLPPCNEPAPPPLPDLIRIDAATFLESHDVEHDVPVLSPWMLVALATALTAAAVWRNS